MANDRLTAVIWVDTSPSMVHAREEVPRHQQRVTEAVGFRPARRMNAVETLVEVCQVDPPLGRQQHQSMGNPHLPHFPRNQHPLCRGMIRLEITYRAVLGQDQRQWLARGLRPHRCTAQRRSVTTRVTHVVPGGA